jgi:hypothetical protein
MKIEDFFNKDGNIASKKLRHLRTTSLWNEVLSFTEKYDDIRDAERIYLFVNQICAPTCYCGKKLKFLSTKIGYRDFCSIKCMSKSTDCSIKKKTTKLNRHGDENYNNREKFKETNKERFGVDFPQQNREISQKRENTCVERFGGNSPACSLDVQNKMRGTRRVRHGDENYNNRKLAATTCVEKYGVTSFAQSEQSREGKSSYRWKNFTFNTGETIRCQGYEPIELKRLETEGYSFSDITPQKRFRYFDTTQNKYRYYFADITIENEKRVIEVKSEYTLGRDKSIADKQFGVELAGYSFEVRVY